MRDDGLTTTELAVLMPVLLVLVMLPIQAALWWHATHAATAAARHAVDAAQTLDATEADGVIAAGGFLTQVGNLTQPTVTVTRTTDTVTATVTGRAPRLLPFGDWPISATASGPVERFIPEPDRQ